jgi:mgtE-like transporter
MNNSSPQDSLLKIFRECILSFSFDFVGLLAGLALSSQLHIFRFSSWIIAVYPAILSAKGMIAGMLTGRLSTALHVGTVKPKFTGNTRVFYKLLNTITVMTLMTSLLMSLIAMFIGMFLWGVEVISFPDIMLAVTATMALGLTILFVTVAVSFLSFRKGLDPDVVVYPIMSTSADVMITIYYMVVINLLFIFGSIGRIMVITVALIYTIIVLFLLLHNIRDKEFVRNIKEFSLTLILVVLIVNFTGTFLNKISTIVKERKEVYTVYPALIDAIGDVGSAVGSVATTKLALGLLKPSFASIKGVRRQILGSWTASLIIFVALSFLSLLLNSVFEPLTFISFLSTLLMANIIAVPVIVTFSYIISILTFKRGLDPDNFVIPIESSLADNITTVALFLALLMR